MKGTIITCLTTLCTLVFMTIGYGQERYRITYDYHSDKVNYLRLDKSNKIIDTLDSPKIRRNSLVELRLRNINPFAVDVQADVKEENLMSSGQGFNFSSLLGGLNSFVGDDLGLNIDNLPETSLFKSEDASRGSTQAMSNVKDLNNTLTNVSALKSSFISNLLNPNLNKEDILSNLQNTADAEMDVRLPSAKDNFYVYIEKVKKTINESKTNLEGNLNQLSSSIEVSNSSEMPSSRGELISRNIALSDLQKLIINLNSSTSKSIQALEEIKSLYTLLEASNFEQIYDYEISADKVDIELKFVQSDFSSSLENEGERTVLKTRHIKLKSKGGFKINTSVALTLNNFGSNSKDYFIDDNAQIGADSNDFFVPNLSTMINFYPFMGESFNIGGSFGLSIPISGTDNVSGINFLFGPSLFFGSKSRLSISGGVAYGPVQQLTNGLEVGDETNFTNVDSFTRNVYDFGYYFGISFSLFDIN